MIMTTLKVCSFYKESFQGDILLSSWIGDNPDRWAGSVDGIKILCVYINLFHLTILTHFHNHEISVSVSSTLIIYFGVKPVFKEECRWY